MTFWATRVFSGQRSQTTIEPYAYTQRPVSTRKITYKPPATTPNLASLEKVLSPVTFTQAVPRQNDAESVSLQSRQRGAWPSEADGGKRWGFIVDPLKNCRRRHDCYSCLRVRRPLGTSARNYPSYGSSRQISPRRKVWPIFTRGSSAVKLGTRNQPPKRHGIFVAVPDPFEGVGVCHLNRLWLMAGFSIGCWKPRPPLSEPQVAPTPVTSYVALSIVNQAREKKPDGLSGVA